MSGFDFSDSDNEGGVPGGLFRGKRSSDSPLARSPASSSASPSKRVKKWEARQTSPEKAVDLNVRDTGESQAKVNMWEPASLTKHLEGQAQTPKPGTQLNDQRTQTL